MRDVLHVPHAWVIDVPEQGAIEARAIDAKNRTIITHKVGRQREDTLMNPIQLPY